MIVYTTEPCGFCRQAKALRERVRRARFEEPTTLEDFDFMFNPKLPVATIRDLATCQFIQAGESVILYGPVGVGKTHVAQALGHAACRRGHGVCFAKTSRLLSELAGGHADGTWEARLRRLVRVDLLILDDFGLREFTIQQGDDFFELVSERHKHGSMVLTSNRAPGRKSRLTSTVVLAGGVPGKRRRRTAPYAGRSSRSVMKVRMCATSPRPAPCAARIPATSSKIRSVCAAASSGATTAPSSSTATWPDSRSSAPRPLSIRATWTNRSPYGAATVAGLSRVSAMSVPSWSSRCR